MKTANIYWPALITNTSSS